MDIVLLAKLHDMITDANSTSSEGHSLSQVGWVPKVKGSMAKIFMSVDLDDEAWVTILLLEFYVQTVGYHHGTDVGER